MITAESIIEKRNKIVPEYEKIIEEGLEEIEQGLICKGSGAFMLPYSVYGDSTIVNYIERSLTRRGFHCSIWCDGKVYVEMVEGE